MQLARRRAAGALAAGVAAGLLPLAGAVSAANALLNGANTEDHVLLAAGDIARCASSGDEQTAAILDSEPGTIAALGDLAYENGTEQEFAECYGPSWGRHKDRTYPIPGNHEYFTPGAAPYYSYFGTRAGTAGQGYYSYDLGAWHVVALNSNCDAVPGGCGDGSPQAAWLEADLEASSAQCTLAYWHHPSFSSGVEHGPSSRMRALLGLLHAARADVLLSGSEHHYERFARQTPAGEPSPAGIRAFVVGTGGALGSYPFRDPPAPNSEVRAEGIRGVLKLTLGPSSYSWRFVPVAGETFSDSGETACHDAPVADSTAPTAPAGLTASSPSARRVDLSWSASSDDTGVAGYRIFRNGAQVGTSSGTSWTDTGLTPMTAYAYHVVAYDAALNVSQSSNTSTVTTRSPDRALTVVVAADTTIEAATPTTNYGTDSTVRTDGSPQKAFLLKFDVTGVGADDVTGAKIRLHVANSSNRGGDFRTSATGWGERTVTWQSAVPGGALVGSFGGVTTGNWHELSLAAGVVTGDGIVAFRVDSTSSDGADYTSREGAAGFAPQLVLNVTEATGPDTQPPSAPTGLTANAATSTRVDLTWEASTDNGRVDGYRILRNGAEIATSETTTWSDDTVQAGTAYTYNVLAFDAAQNVSPPSSPAGVTTPPDSTAPTAPGALSATAVSGTWVDLTWTASVDDIAVTGYRVLRNGTEIGTTTGTTWADRTAQPAQTYSYEVVAHDAAGNDSPRSNPAAATTLPPGTDELLPLRAAFYYPWFPEAWTQSGIFPYTRYTPSLGWYDSAAPGVIANHVAALEYGHFDAAIASWWGRGTRTDNRLDDLLAGTRAVGSSLKWAVYEEGEGVGNPTVDEVRDELTYLRDRYATHPNFLRVGGRFVVFVYNIGDGCEVVDRWRAANTVGAYVVLKVFSGHRDCASQPDSWHQYEPGHAISPQGTDAFSISPGFQNMSEPSPRLARDVDRWRQSIREMIASGNDWQLVTTFNEWGEGTAVESAREWESGSGYGLYLDALHTDGAEAPPVERTLRLVAGDDAYITLATPGTNHGAAATLEADASPQKASLLKFVVAGVGDDRVIDAKLRLHVTNASDKGGDFTLTTNDWSEGSLTWANAPAAGSPLRSLGRVFAATWYELPLPVGAVRGDGAVSFRVDSVSTDGVTYASKEGGTGLAPELVLTIGDPIPDTEPPSAPTALTATALQAGGVALEWTPSLDDVGVAGYRISRDGVELATTASTAYTDGSTVSGTRYTYEVVAFDAAGNDSPAASASTTTGDNQAPTAPTGLAAAATTAGIAVSWTEGDDNVGVTGYRVLRDGAVVATTTDTSYTDTAVASATQYSYAVVAFDAAGNESPASSSVSVTSRDSQAPSAAGGLTASALAAGGVTLGWDASTDDVGVAGYRIVRNGSVLATTAGTSYTDNATSSGTRYSYEVIAYDDNGNSSPPSATATVTTVDTQPPTAPTGLTATSPAADRVDLSWNASTDDGVIQGYGVFRDGTQIATPTATTYSDSSVSAGSRYVYEVRAYDVAGNVSPPSASVTVTTAAVVRTLTLTPTADATLVSGSSTNLGSAAILEADASPRKAFLVKFDVTGVGTGTVTGAKLRLHVTNSSDRGGDFTATASGWTESTVTFASAPAAGSRVGSLGAVSSGGWQEVVLADGAVARDGPVSFRIDSTSSDGAAYDSREAGAALTPQLLLTVRYAAPDIAPPTAASSLTAQAVATNRINLAWTGATDDSGSVGYRIFRNGVELTTTSATTHADTTVAPATAYNYYVVSYDAAGNVAPPSNTATATTPALDRILTFTPIADATIASATPSTNFGAATDLQTDRSPVLAFLLKFNVSGVAPGSVVSAKLRLRVTNTSDRGGDFALAPASWLESAVTWANAPAAGTRVASVASVSSSTWKEVPLAAGAVTGDGIVSLRVDSTSSDGAAYASREAGATAPQLIVTVNP